ncbi:hypothetical protein SESBI_09011 [Sesbania bispinosa]|nr:hypothetical protein SESBI_09011 [Sesbania bispinosa]
MAMEDVTVELSAPLSVFILPLTSLCLSRPSVAKVFKKPGTLESWGKMMIILMERWISTLVTKLSNHRALSKSWTVDLMFRVQTSSPMAEAEML